MTSYPGSEETREEPDCARCEEAAMRRMERAGGLTGALLMFQRMILCPKCGNKRCPKATDHRFDCTGSNDLNQLGSDYIDLDTWPRVH